MEHYIHLSDYKHLFVGDDATLAVQEALIACKKNQPATLYLGGEELHFYKQYAYEREYYISNNDYSKKSIIFPLIDFDGLTVDGEGAKLQFHGEVLPFVIDSSNNITVKNLSVDYPHPYFFQADIVAAEEDYLELSFDTSQFGARVDEKSITVFCEADGWSVSRDRFLVCEFERDTTAPSAYIRPYFLYLPKESDGWFLDRMYRYVTGEQLADNRICFRGQFGHKHTVGNRLIATCGPGRRCPAFFGNRSKNVLLQQITLYASASMGVICQLCENVTLDAVNALPNLEKGRFLSVNADATHFVNCMGTVRLENCMFTNMLDDAVNVHGNYLKIARRLNDRTLLLTYGHPQQRGVNLFDVGDRIHIVDNTDMHEVATLTVKQSDSLSCEYVRLETNEPLPALLAGWTVENLTKMPMLLIYNCTCGYNRPRGILVGTRKRTEIVGNTFYNMNAAINFTGDCNDWFESGPVEDVLICRNNFKNAAYAGGPAISSSPNVKSGNRPYHKNIVIENNTFEMHEPRFLHAKHTENIVFRNNRFIQNDALPPHTKIGEDGIKLVNCPSSEIEI